MRKFLFEYDEVVTLDDVRASFDALDPDERREMTFSNYLADCLGKNGALTEIKTAETPRGQYAVTRCEVGYSDDPMDFCFEWLTDSEIVEKRADGCAVSVLDF